MTRRHDWVKAPTWWIHEPLSGLQQFSFAKGAGAANTAALMCYAVLLHHAHAETGLARIPYDALQEACGLSRTSIANGLRTLVTVGLIKVERPRGTYRIIKPDEENTWGKFPCRALYADSSIPFFHDFRLRHRTELDAMKLLFLVVAFRDEDTNQAVISYDAITRYTGIGREQIKRGLSLLAVNGVVHAEPVPSWHHAGRNANAYRIGGVHSYRHPGTQWAGPGAGNVPSV